MIMLHLSYENELFRIILMNEKYSKNLELSNQKKAEESLLKLLYKWKDKEVHLRYISGYKAIEVTVTDKDCINSDGKIVRTKQTVLISCGDFFGYGVDFEDIELVNIISKMMTEVEYRTMKEMRSQIDEPEHIGGKK